MSVILKCRLGSSAWLILASIILESLMIVKFGYDKWWNIAWPRPVVISWTITLIVGTTSALWWFGYELPKRRRQHAANATADTPVSRPTHST